MEPALAVLLLRIALVALLYGFLGAILFSTWRSLKATDPASQPTSLGHVVVSDPAVKSGMLGGAEYPLYRSTTFGRAPTANVCLQDETVSALHARLSRQGSHWVLEDLNSRNGTFLNGTPIDSPAVLTAEDSFQIGRVVFRLRLADNDRR